MKTKFENLKQVKVRHFLVLFVMVFMLCLQSCSKDTVANENENAIQNDQAVTGQEDQFITKYFLGDEVKVKQEEDGTYSIAGSDIRVFEEQLSDSADSFNPNPVPGENLSALSVDSRVQLWPNNTVVYRIDGLSSYVRSELQKSFNEWTSKTNIKFKERTNESNYVTISSSGSNGNSGYATLGMYGSSGIIKLSTQVTALVIIHEIGHTLGYIHEQNRSDRDNYVIINYQNIQSGAEDQFYISNNSTLLTSQFDINSTMMYGSYTFSGNGRPTITDRNGNVLPERQARLSALDVQGTNALYPSDDDDDDDDTDPNPTPEPEPEPEPDPCYGVDSWSPYRYYYAGSYVTYYGALYQRGYYNWRFITYCGS